MRFLKILTGTLGLVMIAGVVTIVALLVIRLRPAPVALPETIRLPEGVTAEAVTLGEGWLAVVAGDEILVYDRTTGLLRGRVAMPAAD